MRTRSQSACAKSLPFSLILFSLFIFIVQSLFDHLAIAQEMIRVAIFQDIKTLDLKSDSGMTIQDPRGDRLLAKPVHTIHIVPSSDKLLINQKPFSGQTIRIGSNRGDILIETQPFWGVLDITNKQGLLQVVETLNVEDYLRGVVPLELDPKWHPEALKVQAIVARTYALYQKRQNSGKDYDLVATTNDQVYGGKKVWDFRATEAVLATKGRVLTYAGQLIYSAYHSTSAGPTEDAREVWGFDLPYLRGVDCPFDVQSPWYQWDRAIDLVAFEKELRRNGFSIGTIATVTPYRFSRAGRVTRVRVLHSEGELVLRGNEFRRILGYTSLPSSHFKIEAIGQQIHFRGMGSGHGVGLCQWGAKELAERGYSDEQILAHYYPGVQLLDAEALEMAQVR